MERKSIPKFKERLHKFADHNTFCSITFNNGDVTFVSEISYIAKGNCQEDTVGKDLSMQSVSQTIS